MDLTLNLGLGELNLAPGAEGLLEGEIKYNVPEWEPVLNNTGDSLTLEHGASPDNQGFPDDKGVINQWDLKLGATPLNLTIQAGAYAGDLNLSGLPLRNLVVTEGASESRITFDEVNPEEMQRFTFTTGASEARLTGLVNANFAELRFRGGVGDYTLDFSGELQRDATVEITSGLGSLRLIIPSTTAAEVTLASSLVSTQTQGRWSVSGRTYTTGGTGPKLTIEIEMGVGELTLVSK